MYAISKFDLNKCTTVTSIMAYRGLFIEHSWVLGNGPRGLILLAHVLIERLPLSGSSVGLCNPGRVLRDPPVTRGADPDREMTLMPLMKEPVIVDMDTDEVNMDGAKETLVDTVNLGHRGGLGVGRTLETNSTYTGLYIGNIPLQTCSEPVMDDKIANAFNNSTRKTLLFIPPTIQDGDIVVRPTMESIVMELVDGKPLWLVTFWESDHTFIMPKNPPYRHGLVYERATDCTPKVGVGNGNAKTKTYTSPNLDKLRHLPVELWTVDGLSMVASGIGRPLYPDAITRACTRLDFTRVCVMLDVNSKLPKHIIIMMPNEEGGETPYKIDVEYEWLPPKCTSCMTLGHTATACTFNRPSKQAKPSVSIYVPKVGSKRSPPMQEEEASIQGRESQREESEVPRGRRLSREEKAIWNVCGLNKRDHQLAVKGIVAEFRLQFIGLLETRVRPNNIAAIQSFLLPHWKWFVDYGLVGNRIWIAWDENLMDVQVVECSTQFAHCRVHSTDIPWLIGGDFNAVRDMSEICGARVPFEWLWRNSMAALITQDYYLYQCKESDHSPLVLNRDNNQRYEGMFRFDNYLTLSPEFIPQVQQIWQHNIVGTPMYAITRKLKALKTVFRELRRKKGDLSHNVQLAKGFLEMAQQLVTTIRQDELFLQIEHCCRLVLAKAAELEQVMLQQRAKMQWMKEGDQCSRVFFRKIGQRRSVRRILQNNDEQGTTQTNPKAINEFVDYYHKLLGGDRRHEVINLNFLRPWARHLLSDEEANSLLVPFTPADVKQTLFDIAEDKAPGPNGY
ncbi:UNVERIFIED_CONTAM: hypothetical protein Sindi_2345200 [Sesamum indicum]